MRAGAFQRLRVAPVEQDAGPLHGLRAIGRNRTLSPRDAAEERLLLGLRTVEGVPAGTLGALGLSTTAEPVASLISIGRRTGERSWRRR